jgi:hypothetical protein
LSRLFGNVRVDLGRWADVTASYSAGKGLDFHQYLIEASQDPTVFNQDVERFYYSSYYGVRLSPARATARFHCAAWRAAEGSGDQESHLAFGALRRILFDQACPSSGIMPSTAATCESTPTTSP